MALADPQSVTIGTVTSSLPRTSTGVNSSSYNKDDGTVSLTVSHTYGRKFRRVAQVASNKITVDPMISTQNVRVSARAYVVLEVPPTGFSAAEQKELLLSLATLLSASTGAFAGKLVGGEN